MAVPFNACENEIEYLCGYINDNGYIANYFGVPREVVCNVRAKMPKRQRNPKRFLDSRAEPISASSGLTSHTAAREDAIIGSRTLYDKLQAQFRKFEHRHGLKYGAGEILLPAGWNGWK